MVFWTYDVVLFVRVAERQQSQETRLLDRSGQLSLIFRTGTGDTARNDLAGFGDVLAQQIQVFVVDYDCIFTAEAAAFFTSDIVTCHENSLEFDER